MSNEQTVVILVHGYNVSQPANTVGKFREVFEEMGCLVENFTYGYWPFPWQLTRRNPKFAREIAERVRYWKRKGYRVYLAVHSNGAAIARLACTIHRAPIDRILAIHPALHRQVPVCEAVERVIVVHNGGDTAVVAGRLLGRVAKYLVPKTWVFRPWGKMGRDGYVGVMQNHINVDSHSDIYPEAVRCWGHSDEFKAPASHYWLPYLGDLLIRN